MEKKRFDMDKLRAIPISRVVEYRGGRLRKSGSRWVTHCPWHSDEHPSLTLYETDGKYHCHCFACGRGGSVIDYVMARDGVTFWEACEQLEKDFYGVNGAREKSGGEGQDEHGHPTKPTKPIRSITPIPPTSATSLTSPITLSTSLTSPTYIPLSWLHSHLSVENSFCRCLLQMFDRHLVEHLTEEYLLGCYDNGRHEDCVLFPSIDVEGRVRNVKVQHYDCDPHSPRFAHSDKQCCYWLGTTLAREGVVPEDARFDNECLFGEHLLRRYTTQVVALVESPKNALIGAAVQPEYLWLATGNKSMLKRSMMECLRGRQVMVFPDRDAIDDWTALLHSMRDIAFFSVSDFSERFAPQGDAKYDIADYVVGAFLEDFQ